MRVRGDNAITPPVYLYGFIGSIVYYYVDANFFGLSPYTLQEIPFQSKFPLCVINMFSGSVIKSIFGRSLEIHSLNTFAILSWGRRFTLSLSFILKNYHIFFFFYQLCSHVFKVSCKKL